MRYRASGSKNISGMIGNYTASANVGPSTVDSVDVQEFKTSWTVPSLPVAPHNTATLYLWNGLQADLNKPGLLQPVLAWHPGANSWCVSCWYTKDSATYVEGNRVNVSPGDNLEGRIAFMGKKGPAYTYLMEFTGNGFSSTTVTVDMPFAMNFLVLCFEPWTDDYEVLPPDPLVKMRNINVTLASNNGIQPLLKTIPWYFWNNGVVTPSGINGKIVSNANIYGEVDFYFR